MATISEVRAWAGGEVLTAANLVAHVNDPIEDLAGRNGDIQFEDDLKPDDGTTYILPETSSGPNTSLAKNANEQPIFFDSGGTARELFDAEQLWVPSADAGDILSVSSSEVAHKDSGDTRTLRRASRLARPTGNGDWFLKNTSGGDIEWVAQGLEPKRVEWPFLYPGTNPRSGTGIAGVGATNIREMTARLIASALGYDGASDANSRAGFADRLWQSVLRYKISGEARTGLEVDITLLWPGMYLAAAVGTVVDSSASAEYIDITGADHVSSNTANQTHFPLSAVTNTAINSPTAASPFTGSASGGRDQTALIGFIVDSANTEITLAIGDNASVTSVWLFGKLVNDDKISGTWPSA